MSTPVETRASSATTAVRRPARPAPWRRTLLVLHVSTAVGWLGVSAVFLVLTLWLRGVRDAETLRTGYLVHEVMVTWLARPAAIGAAVTGMLLMLTTTWARRRRRWLWGWWVPAKATMVVATVLITAPTSPDLLALVSGAPEQVGTPVYTSAQNQLIALAVLHVVVVMTALTLSVVRPGRPGHPGRRAGQPIQPGLTRPLS